MCCLSLTVQCKTVNCRNSNQQTTGIVHLFLKCIYLFIAPTCFGHSLACYVVQRKNNVYVFQDTVVYISVLQFQFIMCYNYKYSIKNVKQ